MSFKVELLNKVNNINEVINRYLPKEEGKQSIIFEAMNYSIHAGGKRLRPMLMQEAALLFDNDNKDIYDFMAAIEMIHTYSLVHDDLPAMDNDEYRRGRKTTHAVYGEAMGILAGDALLNYAYETAARAFVLEPDNQKVGKAFSILAQKAGVYGMVGGQVVDIETDNLAASPITRDKLDFIYRLKPGALMEASVMVGAVLAGATESEIALMESVAAYVGLAFQIQDDILDVTSTSEVLGKPVGSDERNHKATYVTFEGLDKAKQDVKLYSQKAIDQLKSLGRDVSFLTALISYLIDRDR